MGDFSISPKLSEAFERQNITCFQLREATSDEFFNALKKAKETLEYGACVDLHTKEEYEQMQLFLTMDGAAGIAIERDGNIVSVFNGGQRRGALRTLMPVAIDRGGVKLDNYNNLKLSTLYSFYGFNPVSKVRFDKTFAPADWNYERDGMPDIIFWIHNGDSAEMWF